MNCLCPYCSILLEKIPRRKAKCQACGKFIFIKSTPDNHEKRLMTEQEAESADKAWEAYHEPNMPPKPAQVYQKLLVCLADDLVKYERQGFRSVQVLGGQGRYCSVCAPLLKQIFPVTTSVEKILPPHCEQLIDGRYHCAPFVSPAIKDGNKKVRFDL